INQATIDWASHLDHQRPWILDLTRSRLGDLHEAEDVTQEICLSILRSDPSIDDPTKIRSWLYRIIVRRVADHLRRKYRKEQFEESYGNDYQTRLETHSEGWDWLLASEQRSSLQQAISELEPMQKQLIVLRFVHDQSYEALAERFDVTTRSIEYQLVQAKHKLRTIMQRYPGDSHE
ncbi:MAG: RNA polymerase sigma factor, partial [Planctomycetota bacterium]